jgi:hypothetical protein
MCYLILEICSLFMLLASPLYHFPHGWEVLTSVVHFFLLKRTSSLEYNFFGNGFCIQLTSS